MPVYPYACDTCGASEDRVYSYARRPDSVPCWCGGDMTRRVTAPARTAGKWGDSAARYDRGLGTVVRDSAHRDRIMQARGLVHESDLPCGTVESGIHREITEAAEHERIMSRFHQARKEHGGDAGLAWADTFPAKE